MKEIQNDFVRTRVVFIEIKMYHLYDIHELLAAGPLNDFFSTVFHDIHRSYPHMIPLPRQDSVILRGIPE